MNCPDPKDRSDVLCHQGWLPEDGLIGEGLWVALKPATPASPPSGSFLNTVTPALLSLTPLLPSPAADLKASFDFVPNSVALTEAVGPGG